jgi:phosphate starvation-inducible PhoH-like protein
MQDTEQDQSSLAGTGIETKRIRLQPIDNERLNRLFGAVNSNLKLIEQQLQVSIHPHGNQIEIKGDRNAVIAAADILIHLYRETESAKEIPSELVHLFIRESGITTQLSKIEAPAQSSVIKTPKLQIKPRGKNQLGYVQSIKSHDINFGIGPAGTGKTYLAVACAVEALSNEEVKRILLVRPAVEAGEKLGFLPGDLAQKVDPYLRPLYDALYDMLGFEQVGRLMDKQIIEVAPLAFMRGRTLNHSFIILDESQNTTKEQMKMFLTRIGFGSTAVVTGDTTQIDLPRENQSGLIHIQKVLKEVKGIGFTQFTSEDVVRHPLVQRIVEAYDVYDEKQP